MFPGDSDASAVAIRHFADAQVGDPYTNEEGRFDVYGLGAVIPRLTASQGPQAHPGMPWNGLTVSCCPLLLTAGDDDQI